MHAAMGHKRCFGRGHGRHRSGRSAVLGRGNRGELGWAPIPSTIDPGRAEQTWPMATRLFVQWCAPPGRHERRLFQVGGSTDDGTGAGVRGGLRSVQG